MKEYIDMEKINDILYKWNQIKHFLNIWNQIKHLLTILLNNEKNLIKNLRIEEVNLTFPPNILKVWNMINCLTLYDSCSKGCCNGETSLLSQTRDRTSLLFLCWHSHWHIHLSESPNRFYHHDQEVQYLSHHGCEGIHLH